VGTYVPDIELVAAVVAVHMSSMKWPGSKAARSCVRRLRWSLLQMVQARSELRVMRMFEHRTVGQGGTGVGNLGFVARVDGESERSRADLSVLLVGVDDGEMSSVVPAATGAFDQGAVALMWRRSFVRSRMERAVGWPTMGGTRMDVLGIRKFIGISKFKL
jgi:hypothetical protein